MSTHQRIEAELIDDDGEWSLVLHRRLPFGSTDVWAALTDPAQLAQWAPFMADRDLNTVGTVELTERNTTRPRSSSGAVLDARPTHLLVYEWKAKSFVGICDPTTPALN